MTDRLPLRADRFNVGDEVYYHIPTVMAGCFSWAPPLDAVAKIIAVRDVPRTPEGKVAGTHTQMVRVSPNYCPYGDEFHGSWFLPVGINSHTDPAFRDAEPLDQSD